MSQLPSPPASPLASSLKLLEWLQMRAPEHAFFSTTNPPSTEALRAIALKYSRVDQLLDLWRKFMNLLIAVKECFLA